MKLNLGFLIYIIGFTAILVVAFQWNYDLIRNIFFVWGIISAYSIVISIRRMGKIKKKVTPPYVT